MCSHYGTTSTTWHGISFKEEAAYIAPFYLLILLGHESYLWDSHIFVRVTRRCIKLIYIFIICANNSCEAYVYGQV